MVTLHAVPRSGHGSFALVVETGEQIRQLVDDGVELSRSRAMPVLAYLLYPCGSDASASSLEVLIDADRQVGAVSYAEPNHGQLWVSLGDPALETVRPYGVGESGVVPVQGSSEISLAVLASVVHEFAANPATRPGAVDWQVYDRAEVDRVFRAAVESVEAVEHGADRIPERLRRIPTD